jgi:CBS domain-containing protein
MPRDMPVADVMTTDVVSVRLDDKVRDVSEQMVDTGVDAMPVIDDTGAVVGMISTTDLIVRESKVHIPTMVSILGAVLELPSEARRFDDDITKALGSDVSEVMHEGVITCRSDDTIERAATLMHDHEISRVPVVDDGRLVGIIARGDVLRAIVEASRDES